jgi:hypothetical protein
MGRRLDHPATARRPRSRRSATVASSRVRAFLDFAVGRGADEPALLADAGLSSAELAPPGARIACEKLVAAMRAGGALCGDPALALHFGEAVDVADRSLGGLVGHAREHRAMVFAQLLDDALPALDGDAAAPALHFEASDDGVWVVDARPPAADAAELTEARFASLVCTARRWLRGARMVRAVHVTHPAPPHQAEIERVFGLPVSFGCARNALLIDADWIPPAAA